MPVTLPSVLIRLPNWVGDVCMSLPILDMFEKAQIPYALCARGWAQQLLSGFNAEGFCQINGTLLHDIKAVRAWTRQHTSYQRALVLPDSLSSALIFRTAALNSVGYRDDGRSFLLTHAVDKSNPAQHAAQYWFELARQALHRWEISNDLPALPEQVCLRLTDQHQAGALKLLSTHGLSPKKFVLIAPTATGLHHGQVKVWPHFAALTEALQNEGHLVVMCPPPLEMIAAKRAAPSAMMLPPLDLGSFAALSQLASLVVCNDSGVAHVAAAVGATQITLFGVTNPNRTRPWTPASINLGSQDHWPTIDEVVEQSALSLERLR